MLAPGDLLVLLVLFQAARVTQFVASAPTALLSCRPQSSLMHWRGDGGSAARQTSERRRGGVISYCSRQLPLAAGREQSAHTIRHHT
eukprot:scaffold621592_cov38-Prasinocladus_malaysianus.AAC.1